MGDDAGGGLGEGSSADADWPAEMSIQIHAANSCFPQYITLVYRGALVPYSAGPDFSSIELMEIAQTEWQEWMARP